MKMNYLSKNVVGIIQKLGNDPFLSNMIMNDSTTPFDPSIYEDNCKCFKRIAPYPFNPDAEENDASFIRVYYNQAEFDKSEVISDARLHIDIIVAKNLWLINDGQKTNHYPDGNGDSLIRPYRILERVVEVLTSSHLPSSERVSFEGWQHLAVNTKFDAIRLYAEHFSVNSKSQHQSEQ